MRSATCSLLLSAVLVAAGRAQTARGFPTLEATMATHRVVFRGTIVGLSREVVKRPDPEAIENPQGLAVYTIVVRVDEAFKGKPGARMVLQRKISAQSRRFDRDAKARTSILWFVDRARDGVEIDGGGWTVLRLAPTPPRIEVGTDDEFLPIFSADLRALRTPADALRAARAFAPDARRNPPVVAVAIPRAFAATLNRISPDRAADGNSVDIPITTGTAFLGRRLTQDPAFLFRRADPAMIPSPRDLRQARELGDALVRACDSSPKRR